MVGGTLGELDIEKEKKLSKRKSGCSLFKNIVLIVDAKLSRDNEERIGHRFAKHFPDFIVSTADAFTR